MFSCRVCVHFHVVLLGKCVSSCCLNGQTCIFMLSCWPNMCLHVVLLAKHVSSSSFLCRCVFSCCLFLVDVYLHVVFFGVNMYLHFVLLGHCHFG